MAEQERIDQTLPPLVDLKDFWGRPFRKIEVGLLAEGPSTDLLKWAVTLPEESGFVYQHPYWFVIKASEIGVPAYVMSRDSGARYIFYPWEDVSDRRLITF